MDFSLREIECFQAVAEELSFTRAAKRLRLAQPPLSRHIRILEEKLGVRVFERTNRSVALTSAGALFYAQTRLVVPQLNQAADNVRRHAKGETVSLRIGVVSAVIGAPLIETMKRFRTSAPQVRLELLEDTAHSLLEGIDSGDLEGAFIGVAPRKMPRGVQVTPWRQEPLLAYLPFGHRLATAGECALKDLANETFVAVSKESALGFAEFVEGICLKAGFRPRVVQETPRAQAAATLAVSGAGVALLPASFKDWLGPGVPTIGLSRVPPITHGFAFRTAATGSALQQFRRSLRIG